MHPELAAYDESIRDRLRQIVAAVDGLSSNQLNWRPPAREANSVYALAAHAIGNARAWTLGIAAGRPMGRDRPGEFASSGDDAAKLRHEAAQLLDEITAAFAGLSPSQLDRRLVPDQELWGEGPPHEISVRDAIVQVIEHASLHLGHIQLTRDLIENQQPGN
jgi:hypothetical protein